MTTYTVQPAAGRVAAIRTEPDEKVGSIYIPEQAKERAQVVKIEAVSNQPDPSSHINPSDLYHVGQLVYVGRWAGSDLWFRNADGSERRYLILRPEEILATLEEVGEAPKEA